MVGRSRRGVKPDDAEESSCAALFGEKASDVRGHLAERASGRAGNIWKWRVFKQARASIKDERALAIEGRDRASCDGPRDEQAIRDP